MNGLTGLELAKEVVRSFSQARFILVGGSMLPCLRPGDTLTVRAASPAEVQCGDVVQFLHAGRLVTHRVVSHAGLSLITQGDAVAAPDPPVTAENLLGVVVSIERDGRSFAPPPRPGWVSRFAAGVLRRSHFALRVWLKIHSLRARPLKIVPGLPESS